MSDFRFNGSIAEFDFQGIGEKSNTSFMGTFKVKCVISPIDYLKADRLYRELIGPVNPHLASKDAQNYAFALSQLKFRMIESPDFFKNKEIDGGHLDQNILIDLINLAVDAEHEFKKIQNENVKKLQDMLANRIKNKEIVKEEESEEPIEEDKEIPEIDLEE
jgi:hypothetical protein